MNTVQHRRQAESNHCRNKDAEKEIHVDLFVKLRRIYVPTCTFENLVPIRGPWPNRGEARDDASTKVMGGARGSLRWSETKVTERSEGYGRERATQCRSDEVLAELFILYDHQLEESCRIQVFFSQLL